MDLGSNSNSSERFGRPRVMTFACKKKAFTENVNFLLCPANRSMLKEHFEALTDNGMFHEVDMNYTMTWTFIESPYPFVLRSTRFIKDSIRSITNERIIIEDIFDIKNKNYYNNYYKRFNNEVNVFDIIGTLRLFKSLGLYGTCEYLNKVFKFNNQSMKKAI